MNSAPNIYVAVIDDDESLCRSMSRLLSVEGFKPITFLSAEEFLGDPVLPYFSCLLVDIQLGGMSGLELKERLTADQNRTPVIFLTALDDPAVRVEALQSGCTGYFRKTDPGTRIIEAIRLAVSSGRR
jgi:FixJ family two-component response regulator